MTVDREYSMSSFLTYRTVADPERCFAPGVPPRFYPLPEGRLPVRDSAALLAELERATREACKGGKAALALSGGIDSAILARFMPEGSTAYTFRCVVPGHAGDRRKPHRRPLRRSLRPQTRGHRHLLEDVEALTPVLTRHKGMPVHSIEAQICKAALRAREDGFERLIYGESADAIYGGQDGLLSMDWLAGDFIERYTYVRPWKALTCPRLTLRASRRSAWTGTSTPTPSCPISISARARPAISTPAPRRGWRWSALPGHVSGRAHRLRAHPRRREQVPGARGVQIALPGLRRPEEAAHAPRHQRVVQGLERPCAAPSFCRTAQTTWTGDQKWLVYCLEMFLNLLDTGFAGAELPGGR